MTDVQRPSYSRVCNHYEPCATCDSCVAWWQRWYSLPLLTRIYLSEDADGT